MAKRGGGWLLLLLVVAAFSQIGKGTSTPNAPEPTRNVVFQPDAAPSRPVETSPALPRRQDATRQRGFVTATTLNVRDAPSSKGRVLLKLEQGTPIDYRPGDGWHEVQLADGSSGWVSADYVSDRLIERRAEVEQQLPAFDRAAVVQAILMESRRSYSGSWACPDDTDRAGRRCGRRSAYSKPGGASPLCYPQDVKDMDVKKYLAAH